MKKIALATILLTFTACDFTGAYIFEKDFGIKLVGNPYGPCVSHTLLAVVDEYRKLPEDQKKSLQEEVKQSGIKTISFEKHEEVMLARSERISLEYGYPDRKEGWVTHDRKKLYEQQISKSGAEPTYVLTKVGTELRISLKVGRNKIIHRIYKTENLLSYDSIKTYDTPEFNRERENGIVLILNETVDNEDICGTAPKFREFMQLQ